MRIERPVCRSAENTRQTSRAGFTLAEVLIAVTVMLLLVSGIVFANLFGLRMFQITETKISATDGARKTLGKLADEVRSSKKLWVGNVHNGVFEALLDGETQQGTGLLICPTTNTANYIIYFLNPSDQTFRRTTSSPDSAVILADSVTNIMVFSAQDFSGNTLTNNQNNRVIHVNLEFYQPKRFLEVADYYHLETSITRRDLE